ncbi:MAG: preprotein translocase subunit SecA, partial [Ignavibacteriales bacterium]|nr:preprotein translocase subunit SecA [Ignavibacteriales bacterium]
MLDFFKKLFGSKHERDVKAILPIVEQISKHFDEFQSLTDDQLRAKTTEFRERIKTATAELESEIASLQESLKGEMPFSERESVYGQIDDANKELDAKIQETLDEILPEAFAVVKDTCRRLVGQSWDVAGNKVVW